MLRSGSLRAAKIPLRASHLAVESRTSGLKSLLRAALALMISQDYEPHIMSRKDLLTICVLMLQADGFPKHRAGSTCK